MNEHQLKFFVQMQKLSKAITKATMEIRRFNIAINHFYAPKQRLPRKLKKRIQKQAERAVFELQFESY